MLNVTKILSFVKLITYTALLTIVVPNYENMSKNLTSRSEDYSKWYNELVVKADLAENSAVRGCMVIKPYGYAIWEKMQAELDRMFKETGHQNAYFPLFVPKSLFEAEEKNAEGFAKECAVVTHYGLQNDPDNPGKLRVDPNAKLEEELVVRPTSEAIIWSTFKGWIQSYRDLPLLINQWANDEVRGSVNHRLIKEMFLAALNGVILALFLFVFVWVWKQDVRTALAISSSLVVVIIVAGIIGTFIPLFLHKKGIDPAIATGPFITTSNDIFGILIYFSIAKLILNI